MAPHITGGDVDAFCSKCKLVLAHVIIAMSGARPVRVECKTCRDTHAYRKEAAAPKAPKVAKPKLSKAAGARSRAAIARAAVSASDYEKVMRDRDTSRAQPYQVSVTYAESDIVEHTKFGLGIVNRLLADDKLEVIFPESTRILVHSRA